MEANTMRRKERALQNEYRSAFLLPLTPAGLADLSFLKYNINH